MPYKDPEKRKAASKKGSTTYYEKNKEAVKNTKLRILGRRLLVFATEPE